MTFWGGSGSGSGSADPCLRLMNPDPAIFVIDLQDASKKKFFVHTAYYFLKVHLHHFSKIKSLKESQNSRNQGLSYYFCMMIEGSGSGRPKNMWIRWIRIRNTDGYASRQWRRFTSKYFSLLTANPTKYLYILWGAHVNWEPDAQSIKVFFFHTT